MGAVIKTLLAKTGRDAAGKSAFFDVGDYRHITVFLDAKGAAAGSAIVRIRTYPVFGVASGQPAPTSYPLGTAFSTITTGAVKETKTFSVYGVAAANDLGAAIVVDYSIGGGAQTFGVQAVMRD